jgi:hypothetical protein
VAPLAPAAALGSGAEAEDGATTGGVLKGCAVGATLFTGALDPPGLDDALESVAEAEEDDAAGETALCAGSGVLSSLSLNPSASSSLFFSIFSSSSHMVSVLFESMWLRRSVIAALNLPIRLKSGFKVAFASFP